MIIYTHNLFSNYPHVPKTLFLNFISSFICNNPPKTACAAQMCMVDAIHLKHGDTISGLIFKKMIQT